ncbi:MAG: ScpA family protein [bacterium]
MSELKLEKFEGPLDLLLQLIDQQELDITEISLSQITEQYFHYLDKLEKNRSSKLADFLIIAAKLIYLKSRNLLPQAHIEDEQPGTGLADQLKMYKAYVDASATISNLWNNKDLAYGRIEPLVKTEEFILPPNARPSDLHESITQLLNRIKPIQPLPEVTIDHSFSVKHAIDKIRALLGKRGKTNFKSFAFSTGTRSEIIVSFLALLELMSKKTIIVSQASAFHDLEIQKISN